jgi:hypothetical protein
MLQQLQSLLIRLLLSWLRQRMWGRLVWLFGGEIWGRRQEATKDPTCNIQASKIQPPDLGCHFTNTNIIDTIMLLLLDGLRAPVVIVTIICRFHPKQTNPPSTILVYLMI